MFQSFEIDDGRPAGQSPQQPAEPAKEPGTGPLKEIQAELAKERAKGSAESYARMTELLKRLQDHCSAQSAALHVPLSGQLTDRNVHTRIDLPEECRLAALSPDGQRLAVVSFTSTFSDGTPVPHNIIYETRLCVLALFELSATGGAKRVHEEVICPRGLSGQAIFSPCGRYLGIGPSDRELNYDIEFTPDLPGAAKGRVQPRVFDFQQKGRSGGPKMLDLFYRSSNFAFDQNGDVIGLYRTSPYSSGGSRDVIQRYRLDGNSYRMEPYYSKGDLLGGLLALRPSPTHDRALLVFEKGMALVSGPEFGSKLLSRLALPGSYQRAEISRSGAIAVLHDAGQPDQISVFLPPLEPQAGGWLNGLVRKFAADIELAPISYRCLGTVTSMAISPDEKKLAVGGIGYRTNGVDGSFVQIFDIGERGVSRECARYLTPKAVQGVGFNEDGNLLFVLQEGRVEVLRGVAG